MKEASVFGSDLGLRAGEWPRVLRVEHGFSLLPETYQGKMFMKGQPRFESGELVSVLYSWTDLKLEVWND